MRVITGSARGTRLEAPPGLSTRPTSEMCKEAVFSILHFELAEARVLDLFAGSGQMGIEALSRGAKSCVFVDSARPAQTAIRRNLAAAKLAGRAQVVGMEAEAFLQTNPGPFEIALLDPPYGQQLCQALLPLVAARMSDGGVIVCETGREEELPGQAGEFSLSRTYRYGRAKVSVYRKQQEEEERDAAHGDLPRQL